MIATRKAWMRSVRIPETRRAWYLRRTETAAERTLWAGLCNRMLGGHKFVRQGRIGPYAGDFVCRERKLVVDIDAVAQAGGAEAAHDARRAAFLVRGGYRVLRFTDAEVNGHVERVLDAIFQALADDP